MLGFALVALLALVSIQTWLGWRLAAPFDAPTAWAIRAALAGFTVLLPLTMVLTRAGGGGRISQLGAALGFTLMGLWSIAVAGMLAWEVLRLSGGLLDLVAGWLHLAGPGALLPADPVVRACWARWAVIGILGAAAFLTVAGAIGDRRPPRVVRQAVEIPGLHPDLDGLRIALISDLHVGPMVRRPFVEEVAVAVATLQPDLVACAGDLADGSVEALAAEVAPLASLSAPLGSWFVTGNHEYYSGVDAWLAEVRRLGMTPLLNEHRVLQRGGARLLVAGVPDHRGGSFDPAHRPDPVASLSGAPPVDFKLLLAHQPRSAPAAAKAGFDLVLSGHTHGGQFFPWTEVIHLVEPYVVGWYRLGATRLYVSRGTGTWGPPLRLGAPTEITLLTLSAVP